jgi:hypothetical protein
MRVCGDAHRPRQTCADVGSIGLALRAMLNARPHGSHPSLSPAPVDWPKMTVARCPDSAHSTSQMQRGAAQEDEGMRIEIMSASDSSKQAALARAAKELDAVEVSLGAWAHYDDGMRRWYRVTAEELAELCDYLDDENAQVSSDAYSHWCAGTMAEEMPEGWEP